MEKVTGPGASARSNAMTCSVFHPRIGVFVQAWMGPHLARETTGPHTLRVGPQCLAVNVPG